MESERSGNRRSFDLVDLKAAEADFFLEEMAGSGPDLFPLNFYFSAFLSASRSVTFTMRAVMKGVEGFDEWYSGVQASLEKDSICVLFKKMRNTALKVGERPARGGRMRATANGAPDWTLALNHRVASELRVERGRDLLVLSEQYLSRLVEVVWDCYEEFGCQINAQELLTEECLEQLDMSIDDAEEQLGFPPGWTADLPERERLRTLRESEPGCRIDDLFEKYLGRQRF